MTREINTEVYKRLPTRFDMTGQVVERPISLTKVSVSKGLAKRLYTYALAQMNAAGFGVLTHNSDITVYTLDAEDPPSERIYCVKWQRPEGGYVEVIGIMTLKGWPSLNHGFAIGQEDV